jgi:ATP-binding cassette subfamily B protein
LKPSDDADDLPPGLSSMWRLVRLGYRHEPGLLLAATGMALLAALPDALIALLLKAIGNGAQDHDRRQVLLAGLGLAAAASGTWLLAVLSTRVQRRFRDRISIALEAHVARLQATVSTIAHQERPELLDRLSVLRNQVFVLDHMYMSVLSTVGWVLRLGVTGALLASVHPALLLVVLFALPTVLTSSWRPAVERATEEAAAPDDRLAKHLFTTATTAAPGKEVRVLGIGPSLATQRTEAWQRWYTSVAAARWTSALWHTAGWAVFGLAYVGALVFVTEGLHRPAGDVLLVLAAGQRLSSYISSTVSEIGFLRGVWLDGSRRLVWLEQYADSLVASADVPAPTVLREGIEVQGVSFAYPGTTRLVLEDVSLSLPAGSVVAIVGENGAGKSTLVKLLCKLYEPTSGAITVDGLALARMDAAKWRTRTAGAFQDFARFEFLAQTSVGLGDVPRVDDAAAVAGAVTRAGADDVIERLPDGLATQLGATWPDGADLSIGQWQKLALARGFLREEPLLLVLDEPTSALDAETEHALFERYATAGGNGVTLLVSHRFSTVRMADLIVVLDGSRVAEAGSHEELMRTGGPYSQLYEIQAASYR